MTAAIRAEGLTFRYPDGRAALHGVDLHVADGDRVALLGPNGAGKTTLLLTLVAILRGSGVLEVTGLDATRRDRDVLRALRARVGLVFQDPDDQLFMPTVAEDVAFGPLNLGLSHEVVERRVGEALTVVRMDHAAGRAPHQLSMGERRRVAIATVLAMTPGILVLDEPSANLDPRSRSELVDLLAELDGTMVLATHDLPLAAELCARAVILDGGRIVADGPCIDVLTDEALLAAHDLAVPAGFDVRRIVPRTRERSAGPGGPADRLSA